jgi:L-methionine (R)-S-oxide reductase
MSCSIYRLAPKSRLALQRESHASGTPVPLTLAGRTKGETYAEIDKALGKFLAKYPLDITGRMATLNSFLFGNFPRMNFVGFYTVRAPGALLQVGPYQGEMLACGTIAWGKGVCGTAAAQGATQIVTDVRAVENYIACDEDTLSEIVLPVFGTRYHSEDSEAAAAGTGAGAGGAGGAAAPPPKKLIAVLDIDGDAVGAFDEEDAKCLAALLEKYI